MNTDDLQNEVAAILNINKQVTLTQCIRCSVHTLQLSVENVLKLDTIVNILTKSRKVRIIYFNIIVISVLINYVFIVIMYINKLII